MISPWLLSFPKLKGARMIVSSLEDPSSDLHRLQTRSHYHEVDWSLAQRIPFFTQFLSCFSDRRREWFLVLWSIIDLMVFPALSDCSAD